MAALRGEDTLSVAVIGQNDRHKSYVCWVGGEQKMEATVIYTDSNTYTVPNTARIRKQSRIYGKLSIRASKTFIQKVKKR